MLTSNLVISSGLSSSFIGVTENDSYSGVSIQSFPCLVIYSGVP